MMVRFLAIAVGVLAAAQNSRVADQAAADLIGRSRASVRTASAAESIRSLRLKGRLRIPAEGAQPSDGAVEIRIQLPDRYVRIDSVGPVERWSGFDGGTLLTATREGGRVTPPARSERAALLAQEREQLTWFLLGLAAIGDSSLNIRMADESFPDTRSLDVTQGRAEARLVLDADSAVPLRIVYWAGRRGNTVTSFADRRSVGGFLLPHRITTTTPTHVLETLVLDEIAVNPALGDADFRAPSEQR